VANFSAAPRTGILTTCLQFPLKQPQLEALKPMEANLESQYYSPGTTNRITQWNQMPFGLWQYRCGDFAASADWCQQGLAQKNKYPACVATLHIVLAMACYQRGQTGEACSELDLGRQLIEARFQNGLTHGNAGAGYWYDWIFARHLLREATALIDCNSAQPETEG
jgi:hypothetical protein